MKPKSGEKKWFEFYKLKNAYYNELAKIAFQTSRNKISFIIVKKFGMDLRGANRLFRGARFCLKWKKKFVKYFMKIFHFSK